MQARTVNQTTMYDVEKIRTEEYPQLREATYLDHTGTTLYAKSLVYDFANDLVDNLYGNPHSASTPSINADRRIEAVREKALRFFNADPEHFDLIFVANATAAMKLIYEAMRDRVAATGESMWYGYHKDAHNSLVGIREATSSRHCFVSDEEVECFINSETYPSGPQAGEIGLFAYPGQSNMTGRRLPLDWSGRIRRREQRGTVYTLLDAAALASTAPIDLSDSDMAPDFVALSFYKIFGFPNLGALIVRKDGGASDLLDCRRYFGGGTVEMVMSVNHEFVSKRNAEALHRRHEDGTLPFTAIFALDHAISTHYRLYGTFPMQSISKHTSRLVKKMHDRLSSIHHANGRPAVRIYKDAETEFGDPKQQGGTIAFNVLRSNGQLISFEDVEQAADEREIYLRSGAHCNPGGVATYLKWSPPEMQAAYAAGLSCSEPVPVLWGKSTGVVRASVGAMSNDRDVENLVRFITDAYVEHNLTVRKSPSTEVSTRTVPVHSPMPVGPSTWARTEIRSLSPPARSAPPPPVLRPRTPEERPEWSSTWTLEAPNPGPPAIESLVPRSYGNRSHLANRDAETYSQTSTEVEEPIENVKLTKRNGKALKLLRSTQRKLIAV